MVIKELSKTKAKELKALSSKKERERHGLFLVEGEKCFIDTYGAFPLRYLICSKDWIIRHPEYERKLQNEILISDKRNIEIISTLNTPPEVIGVFEKPLATDFLPSLENDKFYLLLDEIQDPGNLGTIIRTCDWFGIYDIFASKNTVDVYSPKVIQSTMGSLSRVKVHYLDLEKLIENNRKIKVIGTLLNGLPLNETNVGKGGMLIMGNEGRGISENLKKYIDVALTITPANLKSHPDSLNVAIATAITLFHIVSNP